MKRLVLGLILVLSFAGLSFAGSSDETERFGEIAGREIRITTNYKILMKSIEFNGPISESNKLRGFKVIAQAKFPSVWMRSKFYDIDNVVVHKSERPTSDKDKELIEVNFHDSDRTGYDRVVIEFFEF